MLTSRPDYAIIRPWKGTRALNERKERKMMYVETTMEWKVEQALAEMEKKGEKLPDFRLSDPEADEAEG